METEQEDLYAKFQHRQATLTSKLTARADVNQDKLLLRRMAKISQGKLFSLMGTFNTHAAKKEHVYQMTSHKEREELTQKTNSMIPETAEGKMRMNKGMMFVFKAGLLNKINALKESESEVRSVSIISFIFKRLQRKNKTKSSGRLSSCNSVGQMSKSSRSSSEGKSPIKKSRLKKQMSGLAGLKKSIRHQKSDSNSSSKNLTDLDKEKSGDIDSLKSKSAVTSFPSQNSQSIFSSTTPHTQSEVKLLQNENLNKDMGKGLLTPNNNLQQKLLESPQRKVPGSARNKDEEQTPIFPESSDGRRQFIVNDVSKDSDDRQ